jgi:amino acid transporter
MARHLERNLGLVATTTVSIGAMIGSGIFVLPGLAFAKAGPAVILAYFLAGAIVLPAALSKAEMATALPEAGGTYLYIDRAMGPLPGTIAGIGAWFSLVFKSAFALVGLGAYLLVVVEIPGGLLTVVGVAIAALLLAVNVVGVEQTGRLQVAIVGLVLLSLVGFVVDGGTFVDATAYHPFFPEGGGGLLAATGFVFVSYAGVTKIASVAEEVEDPGRNIPRAILGSVVLMMLVYTLTAFVVVGVTPPGQLRAGGLTPMADAAAGFLGDAGRLGIAAVAVLALASMANAGILSSSRYPLAMSRDSLAPARFGRISERFRTPVDAITVTGALLLALIVFVPVDDLAKLASAFQILVFAFVNVALIAFRESELDWYDPAFVAPGYPWVQLFGVGGSAVLLGGMGPIPLAGAAGIVLAGGIWYRVYGREKTDREGAALDALRRSVSRETLESTERAVASGTDAVLVVTGADADPERVLTLARIGAAVVAPGGRLRVTRIESVPEQTTLSSVADSTAADVAFEERVTSRP